MSGPPGYPFPGFRPGMPGGMPFPNAPPGFGGMLGMGMRPMMMTPGGMGMGGMPLGMGMPGMRPPMVGASPMGPRPPLGPSALAKSGTVYVPPSIAEKSTTVYVGKIASTIPDEVIKTLLDSCGRVKSWKRQVDPDTKQPKGFGFCEFEDAEGVLRAMRLLNGLKMDGQELLLKCNAATQKYTEQYEQQKTAEKSEKKAKAAAAKAAAEAAEEGTPDAVPDAAKEGQGAAAQDEAEEDEDAAADNRVLELIMSIVSDREDVSRSTLPPPPPLPGAGGAAQAANEFLAQLASPTSSSKPAAEHGKEVKDRDTREREREMREREREWAREAEAERRKEEDRRRELDAKYEVKLHEWERYERERANLRDREVKRSAQAEADWRRSVRTDLDAYESDDDREYWERRPIHGSRKAVERRKRRLAEEEEDEVDRQREAREVERRAKRAAAAAAAGEASGQEGTPGPAGSVVYDAHPPQQSQPHTAQHTAPATPQVKAEVVAEAKVEPEVDTNDPIYQAMLAAARAPPPVVQPHHRTEVKVEEVPRQQTPGYEEAPAYEAGHGRGGAGFRMSESPPPLAGATSGALSGSAAGVAANGAGGAVGGSGRMVFGVGGRVRANAALVAMFGDEEETIQKRKLKPIRYSEEEMLAVTAEGQSGLPSTAQLAPAPVPHAVLPARPPTDPKTAMKAMMDSIPTTRDGVFSYKIKWSHYNAAVMGEKFKGWVSSKVTQLLGVQEPTLVDYVVKLLGQQTAPDVLHAELSPVLDNDTETFVIKLYRMVIYETEKAALGLGQSH